MILISYSSWSSILIFEMTLTINIGNQHWLSTLIIELATDIEHLHAHKNWPSTMVSINCGHQHWQLTLSSYICQVITLRGKSNDTHKKSLRQKKLAPRFDLKSVDIIKKLRPFIIGCAPKELISHEHEKGRPQQIPFVSLRGKRGARGTFNIQSYCIKN